MIDKFFFKYNTYSSFKEDKTTSQIPEDAICFIKDKKIIYTRGIEFSTQSELVEWSGKVVESAEIQSQSTLNKESKNIVFIKSIGCFAYDLNGNGSNYINNWGNLDLFQTGVYISGNIPSLKNNIFIDLNKKIWIVTGDKTLQEIPSTSIGQVDPNSTGGEIFNDYINNKATGDYSHAEGNSTTASGENSHAEGINTKATEINSHAEGMGTTASGDSSHSEGMNTTASGAYSHAEGTMTTATGIAAHAEGNSTNAEGENSHAEGNSTNAYNDNEHAEGSFNKSYKSSDSSISTIHTVGIGNFTEKNAHEIKFNGDHYVFGLGGYDGTNSSTANTIQEVINEKPGKKISGSTKGEIFNDLVTNTAEGKYSHAEGESTTASGIDSHAEGYVTAASGNYSHAEGQGTNSSGINSHAEGYGSRAIGTSSHAEGQNTNATGTATHAEGQYTQTYQTGEHAEGTYNKSYNSSTSSSRVIHSVGIGTSTSARKNAHEIKFNGDHYVYGIGGYDGTNSSSAKTLQEVINPSISTVKTVNGVAVNSTSQSYSFTSSDANYDVIRMLVNYSDGGCAYLNIQNVFLSGFKSIIDSKGGYAKIKLMIKNNGTAYIALRLNGSKFVNSNGEKWGNTCTNQVSYNGATYNVGTNIPDLGDTSGAAEFGGYGIIDIEGMWWDDNQYLITILFDRLGTSVQ